jgi:hypothetical protein
VAAHRSSIAAPAKHLQIARTVRSRKCPPCVSSFARSPRPVCGLTICRARPRLSCAAGHPRRALSAWRRRRHGAHHRAEGRGQVQSDLHRRQIAAASAVPSALASSRTPNPTATSCCSAIPARSRSIRASTRSSAWTRARILRRSGGSPRCRSRCSRIRPFQTKTVADVIALAKKDPGKLNRHLRRRHGRLHVRRIVQGGSGARRRNHSLQGHRAADDRSARRPRAGGLRVLPPALGNLQAGQLRAIAVPSPAWSASRSCPKCRPSMNPSGMPGSEAVLHYGLLAPPGRRRISSRSSRWNWASSPGTPRCRNASVSRAATRYRGRIRDRYRPGEKKWGALVRRLGLKVE